MTHRRTALAVLLCIGVAAVVGGLIAMIWHVVPEQYSLLMRWVAYGLICIGVQCGCLLVRCMCMGPDSSCCPAVDHAVTPGVEGGLATGRHGMRTSRTGEGVVFDPDDKPPAYSQVIYEEGQPPPPFLDALRRESMDEALQAETEAEFIREALRARQAATRRAEMRARKAEIQARNEEGNTAEEAATQQTEAEVEAGQSAAEVETRLTGPPAGDDVGGTQTGTEDSRTEAVGGGLQTEVFQADTVPGVQQDEIEDDVFEISGAAANTELPQTDRSAPDPEPKTEGDIFLAEAIKAEAASKALLSATVEAQTVEQSQATAPTSGPKSASETAGCPTGDSDSAEEPGNRRPEETVPQR